LNAMKTKLIIVSHEIDGPFFIIPVRVVAFFLILLQFCYGIRFCNLKNSGDSTPPLFLIVRDNALSFYKISILHFLIHPVA
jgi:hypothetical protein